MEYKSVFKRYELKYLMDEDQAAAVRDSLTEHMAHDRYGHSVIRNVYLDTPDFLLARRSIERPLYKEKLRFRAYSRPSEDDDVFVELKKKSNSVVYKRRLTMPLGEAEAWFSGLGEAPSGQIAEEIDFMRVRYPGIAPAMFLSYSRDAYCARGSGDLRITVDSDIRARTEDLDLSSEVYGREVLPAGYTLLEIKTMYGYPFWLLELLNSQHLYKSSFTKYGNAYKEIVLGKVPEEFLPIRTKSAVPMEVERCPPPPPP
ncbi:MAG: polyphosphate polymerase domain-containing protein [Candidatus Methanomethylophilaceae archaeon]|nr:polyphosphate polymerase domain-containing protein [Candidatus Methanomethylophilaceae archaeon]